MDNYIHIEELDITTHQRHNFSNGLAEKKLWEGKCI